MGFIVGVIRELAGDVVIGSRDGRDGGGSREAGLELVNPVLEDLELAGGLGLDGGEPVVEDRLEHAGRLLERVEQLGRAPDLLLEVVLQHFRVRERVVEALEQLQEHLLRRDPSSPRRRRRGAHPPAAAAADRAP